MKNSIVKSFLSLLTVMVLLFSLTGCIAGDRKWLDSAVIYEVNIRQYTEEGTFAAFSEHLPRLQELGVKILWFMPIHPISEEKRKGSLGSYYAVSDYKRVNPEFGTKKDFTLMIKKPSLPLYGPPKVPGSSSFMALPIGPV